MKTFCTILLLFSWTASLAGQGTLTWTTPTLNSDGTPLTDLAGFIIYWGPTSGTYPNSMDIPDPAATTTIVSNLTEGTWYFVVTAYDDKTPANESLDSNEAVKSLSIPPAAPGMLTVTNLTAFTVVKQRDKFILLAVGTVPANTTCDPNQSVNGRYVVPIDAVTFTGTVGPNLVVVVANCS